MNKLSFRFKNTLLLLLLVVVCVLVLGITKIVVSNFQLEPLDSAETGNTPNEIFEYLIHRPIPEDISNLQGGGYTWQGYSVWLRFQGNRNEIKNLITNEYELVNCLEILPKLKLHIKEETFHPKWQPELVNNPECYWTSKNISNEWTYAGKHYLLIDWNMMMVYFYGIGG